MDNLQKSTLESQIPPRLGGILGRILGGILGGIPPSFCTSKTPYLDDRFICIYNGTNFYKCKFRRALAGRTVKHGGRASPTETNLLP